MAMSDFRNQFFDVLGATKVLIAAACWKSYCSTLVICLMLSPCPLNSGLIPPRKRLSLLEILVSKQTGQFSDQQLRLNTRACKCKELVLPQLLPRTFKMGEWRQSNPTRKKTSYMLQP